VTTVASRGIPLRPAPGTFIGTSGVTAIALLPILSEVLEMPALVAIGGCVAIERWVSARLVVYSKKLSESSWIEDERRSKCPYQCLRREGNLVSLVVAEPPLRRPFTDVFLGGTTSKIRPSR
jgi:hypothetical protein